MTKNFSGLVAIAAALAISASSAHAQTHVYLLNGNLNDQNAGPSLVSDGGAVGSGYTFSANQGLSLSNVLTTGTYTIAFHSMFDTPGGYQKMLDFKDRTSDDGWYDYGNSADFYPVGTGGLTYAPGVMAFTVLTRDAGTNMFNAYVNGAQSLTFNDASGRALFTGTNNIARFFEDDFGTSQAESAAGYVDYIAIWDTALSADDVAALSPTTTTPEPASVALLATGLVGIGGVVRRKRIHHR